MAENEKEIDKTCQNDFLFEQTDEANDAAMRNLAQQYQGINYSERLDDIQQENKIKENEDRSETKLVHKISNHSETEQNLYSIITNNTFQMRVQVLNMEKNIIKSYCFKQLISNEKCTWTNIQNMETCIDIVFTLLTIKNFEKAEKELLLAENLSTSLMSKVKKVLHSKAAKKEDMQKPESNVEVPDYRSTVTVRGTKEDVKKCILKATAALENGKYDKAESLLLKAERICSTKNARDLLKQVQTAKKLKQNPELVEKATKSEEYVYIIKNKDLTSVVDNVSAAKCLTAFEKAFTDSKFVKAERLLNKAKRFNPLLDIDDNMSRIKVATANSIMEENPKNGIEEANREFKTPGEYHYITKKIYDVDDSKRVKRNLNDAKTLNPSLDLKSHLEVPNYRSIVTVRGIEEDVVNCIRKATAALEYGTYDRAENLLLEAERIFPTQKARDLLKLAVAAKELTQNPELNKKSTKSLEHAYTIKKEELTSVMNSVSVVKTLTAFEKAFNDGKFVKTERKLHKAITFNRSLDAEENISLLKVATADSVMKENPKKMVVEANTEFKTVGEYHYMITKTCDVDDSGRVEQNLKDPKILDPFLNLESHLSKRSPVIASWNLREEKSKIKRSHHQ